MPSWPLSPDPHTGPPERPSYYPPMTYILDLGPWHVGPFPTHVAAQYWAETHGVDQYRMIPLDDPAEAPGRIYRMRNSHPQAAQI